MTRKRMARRGFSLIELLVVLVILALLVGLVAPKFLTQTEKGQVATAKTQIESFKSAIDIYRLDHSGNLPQSLDDLINAPSSSEGGDWKGPYLKDVVDIPADPWKNAYEYTVPGPAGQDYEIVSYGKDGKPGGSNFDADISSIK
jgi:general secretion pathway protein G